MPEKGGTNIFLFNLNKQRASKKEPDFSELGITSHGDIIVNPTFSNLEGLKLDSLESSLQRYLQYLYVEYPEWVRIKVNDKLINLANPCSVVKQCCPGSFVGKKTDRFAV